MLLVRVPLAKLRISLPFQKEAHTNIRTYKALDSFHSMLE